MDGTMYEQIKEGIHATCDACARKIAALNIVFGRDADTPAPAYKNFAKAIVSKNGAHSVIGIDPALPGSDRSVRVAVKNGKVESVTDVEKTCAICHKNRIRSDNAGCPTCGRKVCKECKAGSGSTRSGNCVECAPTLPDTRAGNGGARPNSGPKRAYRKQKDDATLPPKGSTCESCRGDRAVVKCAGCTKMICGACARQLNGQCTDCEARLIK